MQADFAVECDTIEHNEAKTLAWIGLLLYPFGISLLYTVLFRKAKRAILDDRPTALSRALGFLTLDYEKEWFAWELFEASFTRDYATLYAPSCLPCVRAVSHPRLNALLIVSRLGGSCSSWASLP